MGIVVLKNPRVVTVTDPVFGPRKEVQVDLYDDWGEFIITGYQQSEKVPPTFICIVSLGKPVETDEEPAPPSAFRPTT